RADPRQPRAALRRRRHRRGLVRRARVGRDGDEGPRAPRRARSRAVKRAPNFNALWSRALVDELARGGVRDAVIAPGSRSAAPAPACAERLRVHPAPDGRGAASFAPGGARASRGPVAVVAPSGSAGAPFSPAILEAEASGVPMVAITADRPPELHGWGAPQTIDQGRFFGGHGFFPHAGGPQPAAPPPPPPPAARAPPPAAPPRPT